MIHVTNNINNDYYKKEKKKNMYDTSFIIVSDHVNII